MIKQKMLVMTCVAGLALTMASAHAEVDKRARSLSASCAACHGTNGKSAGGMPVLAGLDKAYFVTQMKDFKSGTRPATVMHHHASGYTDEEYERMAEYFSAQSR